MQTRRIIMANWCQNYVSFYGETDELQKEFEELITKQQLPESCGEGFLPKGLETGSRYMFDVELEVVEEHKIIILKYDTKWAIDEDVLEFIANEYNLEFKGVFMEEQELTDTCGYVVGVRDMRGKINTIMKTLSESGINFEVADVDSDDDRPEGLECEYNEILNNACDELARLVFNSLRDITQLNNNIGELS
jgi:hypothetical protein